MKPRRLKQFLQDPVPKTAKELEKRLNCNAWEKMREGPGGKAQEGWGGGETAKKQWSKSYKDFVFKRKQERDGDVAIDVRNETPRGKKTFTGDF